MLSLQKHNHEYLRGCESTISHKIITTNCVIVKIVFKIKVQTHYNTTENYTL